MAEKDDDIDLGLVFTKIGHVFTSLWDFLLTVFQIAKKRWGLLLLCSLLGAGTGAGLFLVAKPVYCATLTLSSKTLSNDFCADIINNLELIIKDNSPELLAKTLKIDVIDAKAIKGLAFDNYDEKLKKKYEDKDTIVLGLPFRVNASAFNNTVFFTLQNSLVNYLEDNEYALKRKQIKIKNTMMLRANIKKQISQLDSLKFKITADVSPRGTASGFVFGQPIDPINIFKEETDLFENDLELSKELSLIENIQIIQGFQPRDKPDSPRLIKYIVLFLSGFFILGLIISLLLERKKHR